MFVFLSSYPALLFKTKTQGFGSWCGRSKPGTSRERGRGPLWNSSREAPQKRRGKKQRARQSRVLHTSAGQTAVADAGNTWAPHPSTGVCRTEFTGSPYCLLTGPPALLPPVRTAAAGAGRAWQIHLGVQMDFKATLGVTAAFC